MLRFAGAIAAICCVLAAGAAAQGRAAVPAAAPAETPPPGFTGRQYVDSRGCAFIRAGFGGQVTWVPRITLDREQVCGLPPSLGGARASAAPQPAAPQPAPPQTTTGLTGRLAGCPAAAPYGQRVTATDGRRGLLCTAAPARVVSGPIALAQVAAAPSPPRPAPAASPAPASPAATARPAPPPAPPGYKPVWTDDRLNPHRGGRTEGGRSAMNAVWTQTVPRRLVDPRDKGLVPGPGPGPVAGQPRISTRSAPAAVGPFVQVGVFERAANADRAAERLAVLGLPARIRPLSNGAGLVTAGPFAGDDAARAALAAARAAGFGDAFLRR